MSDTTLIRLARTVSAISLALIIFGTGVVVALGGVRVWVETQMAFFSFFEGLLAVVVWLAILSQPRNAAVWSLLAGSFFGGVYYALISGAASVVADPAVIPGIPINLLVPAQLPEPAAWMLVIAGGSIVSLYFPLTVGLLWFPDGRAPTPGWRWVSIFSLASIIGFALALGWGLRPSNTGVAEDSVAVDVAFLACTVAVGLALASLIVRYVRGSAQVRQQIKWVVWGASVLVPAVLLAGTLAGTDLEAFTVVPLLVAGVVFFGSYAIAITRYRLYNIDIVISRTVTYGVLAVLLAAGYAVVVVGVGSLIGRGDEPDLWLSLGAIAGIAIVFEPVRLRLERRVNRMVYGQRATPHEVLSRLTTDLMESHESEDSMAELAQLLTEGTGASDAIVWLRVGEKLRPAAAVSDDRLDHISEIAATELPESDTTTSVVVRHGDEMLGVLTITKPRNEPATESDRRLLEDVAAGAGLMFRNQRLRAELADRARQVSLSRLRLIEAHDSARHRLERDLHDGAQQQVVALKVKLGLAHAVAEQEGFPELADAIDSLADDTQRAVDEMRALAHGIYPPLLEAQGIRAAISASMRSIPIPVEMDVEDFERFPRPIEQTAYFIVTELLGEAVSAGASLARLEMRAGGGIEIALEFDAPAEGWRSTTLSDRIEAVGGEIETAIAQQETRVEVRLPRRTLEPTG